MAVRVIPNYGDTRGAALRDAWQALVDQRLDASLFYQSPPYFDHLAHREDRCALSLAVVSDGSDATVGVVPLWAAESTLQFRVSDMLLGKMTFASLRVLGGNPLVPQSPALFRELLRDLGRAFPDCALIEIKGLPTSSELWKFLRDKPSIGDLFHIYVPHGPRQCQWTEVPTSFDEYLARFKRKKRYNLKRQVARLAQHGGGTLELRRIDEARQVPFFLGAVERLAPNRLKDFMSAAELRDLAERRLLLSYVLTSGSAPCSLVFATRFAGTQLVHMFAHDPALDHLSPGTVANTLMIRDLAEHALARRIDYGFGEPRYRLGNHVEERVLVMLVRKTLGNLSGIMAHATFDGVVKAMKQVIRRRANGSDMPFEEDAQVVGRPRRLGALIRSVAKSRRSLSILAGIGALAISAVDADGAGAPKKSPDSLVERGRYIVRTSGCNDCHTPGYALAGGKVDEQQWLVGDSLGWRGPWGTTYPVNLRLYMQTLTEKEWVAKARKLETRPPMPWFALNAMTDTDLRAIYRFARALGPAGEPAPAYVPPTQEPKPPYVTFPAPPK